MTPTPEQVAAWAREAGVDSMPPDHNYRQPYYAATPEELQRFAALVDAHRAEQDARFADCYENNSLAARSIAAAIRASVKGTTCQN